MEAAFNAVLLRRGGSSDPASTPPASLSGLIATLIPILLVSGVMFLLFLILRRTQSRTYAPRTFLSTLREQERTPVLPKGLFNWFGAFFNLPDTYVLNHQSLDGYLLLRFLKIATVICLVGCIITFPVLFPVNATAGGLGQQLDILSMSNVPRNGGNNPRFYAHCFVGWVFFTFVWFMIARESIYYINIRQAYLLSPLYANRISSRTVLFSSVPVEFLVESKIRNLFSDKVKNLWIATDCKKLADLVKQRDKVAMKLEGAETKLITLSNKARLKSQKTGGHEEEHAGDRADVNGESGSVAARWTTPKDRPTHKTKFLVGKKVDTINWCRAELERLIPEVEAEQNKHKSGDAKMVNSVFVEFHTQSAAQAAYQTVAHHQALHMAPRFIGVNPNEVIWNNLRIKWYERVVRNYLTIGFVCVLIIFWAIPVAFVGILSNIQALENQYQWLHWLTKIPPTIMGVVTGLLPSVLLAVLMALLPIILRLMAKLGGMPSSARVELRTQNFYFAFQVVQVFLVTTLASSATSVGNKIANDPSLAPTLLAQSIPTASNFYLSYFIVQGLTLSTGALLQIVGLILGKILGRFLDNTPRKMYKRFSSLGGLGWGTVFPIYTLLLVVAITYSIIAPLVLLFATIGLYLLYLANRYNFLFVFNANIDTKGLIYPRALQQVTTGLYLAVVCLIGLFGIATTIGPLILMVIYLIFMILFHVSLNSALDPLLNTIPRSLEVEEQGLLALENGNTATDGLDNGHHRNGDGYGNGNNDYGTKTHGTSGTINPATSNNDSTMASKPLSQPAPHKKPSLITKFLKPHIYADYATLRRLVPTDFGDINYEPEIASHAYYNPAVASKPPLLWFPRDVMGVSRQAVAHSSRVIPCSDEGAGFDDKGKLQWDHSGEAGGAPIHEEKVYY